ncbi:DMT family transporter [Pseudoroseomonas globiformis]|uniref:DMT family transporter n=1 Tax=Teichococcus globiformis TaxID=2307229 RepID=A0ABV7FSZ8_9PROT
MTQASEEQNSHSAPLVAISLILFSSLLYVVGYSLSKVLVESYGLTALQVTFLRCAMVLGGGLCLLPWSGSGINLPRLLVPPRAWEQRAAAAALVVSNALAIVSYSLMPVTTASALGFTTPLLLAAFGSLFLGERASWVRWIGTGIGFSGMLLIVRPGTSPVGLGIVAALGAAVTYSLYQILIRRLRTVASSLDTALQVALVGTVLLAGPMMVLWQSVSLQALAIMALCTLIQTAALASLAAALRRGEASQLAPWQFSGLLWAMLIDAVMFSLVPSAYSILGGVLIIGGGILAQLRFGR